MHLGLHQDQQPFIYGMLIFYKIFQQFGNSWDILAVDFSHIYKLGPWFLSLFIFMLFYTHAEK